MSEKVSRRDQVKELITKGSMTKAQIAEKLGVKEASVSSQMTYLRWMGMFIMTNADKILSFCTEEEYKARLEEIKANRKTKSASSRTPEEQAVALAKTITSQTTSQAKWKKKLEQISADLADAPDDEDLTDLRDEAEANLTLLRIKLKRNMAKAVDLPDVPEDSDSAAEDTDSENTSEPVEDEDLL